MSEEKNAGRDGMDELEGTSQRSDRDRERCGDSDAWWYDRSLPMKILIGIGFAILGIGFLVLVGWVVMALWNWLMPEIFGLKTLNYRQAWGLLILSSILFKGINLGSEKSGRRSDRRRKKELRRYMQEDPAES